jgi:hypothetical protein
MNLHISTAARRILAAAAVTCAAAATPAMALASTSAHPGIREAGAKAVRHQTATNCTDVSPFFFNVTKSGVNYWLGAPNTVTTGAAATLKPKQNRETSWTLCLSNTTNNTLIENGGMALTSRATSPGATVTFEPAGNSGNGFASQQWTYSAGSTTITLQNVKTGLFLRVPNTGPIMGQAVTTGNTPTVWNYSS